jgi:hypothetical protein
MENRGNSRWIAVQVRCSQCGRCAVYTSDDVSIHRFVDVSRGSAPGVRCKAPDACGAWLRISAAQLDVMLIAM